MRYSKCMGLLAGQARKAGRYGCQWRGSCRHLPGSFSCLYKVSYYFLDSFLLIPQTLSFLISQ